MIGAPFGAIAIAVAVAPIEALTPVAVLRWVAHHLIAAIEGIADIAEISIAAIGELMIYTTRGQNTDRN